MSTAIEIDARLAVLPCSPATLDAFFAFWRNQASQEWRPVAVTRQTGHDTFAICELNRVLPGVAIVPRHELRIPVGSLEVA